VPGVLGEIGARAVEERVTIEAQRALSVRAQLQLINDLALAHGLRPIVLKGGHSALRGTDVFDAADVDVLLLGNSQAERLAKLLDTQGYEAASGGNAWHLAPRREPYAVPIEVHQSIRDVADLSQLVSRARPLEALPGLLTFESADHLWYLLVHSVISHPYRRGRLRDLLLVRTAAADCGQAVAGQVMQRIAAHAQHASLETMFALARSLDTGENCGDPFRSTAAANYLLQTRFRWLGRLSVLEPFLSDAVFNFLGTPADRRAELDSAFGSPIGTSRWPSLAGFERAWPTMGRTVRRAGRVARFAIAKAVALPVAMTARRSAEADGPRR